MESRTVGCDETRTGRCFVQSVCARAFAFGTQAHDTEPARPAPREHFVCQLAFGGAAVGLQPLDVVVAQAVVVAHGCDVPGGGLSDNPEAARFRRCWRKGQGKRPQRGWAHRTNAVRAAGCRFGCPKEAFKMGGGGAPGARRPRGRRGRWCGRSSTTLREVSTDWDVHLACAARWTAHGGTNNTFVRWITHTKSGCRSTLISQTNPYP